MKEMLIEAQRQEIVDAFCARHGLTPDECEQVVRTDGQEVRFWVRRRTGGLRSVEAVLDAVCDAYGAVFVQVQQGALLSGSRKQDTVRARQIAMYILRKHCRLTLKDIGRSMNRDHATVIHGTRTAAVYMLEDPDGYKVYTIAMKALGINPSPKDDLF